MSKFRISPKDDLGTKLDKIWAACVHVHNLREDLDHARLVAMTGGDRNTVYQLINRLVSQGKLKETGRGDYEVNNERPKFDPANGKVTRASRYTGVL